MVGQVGGRKPEDRGAPDEPTTPGSTTDFGEQPVGLGTVGLTAEDTWYWVRVQANGTEINRRYWEVAPRNRTLDIEATPSLLEAGWVGVGSFDPEANHWDVVSVGWGGKSAPLPRTRELASERSVTRPAG